jgi:hypothetical protein
MFNSFSGQPCAHHTHLKLSVGQPVHGHSWLWGRQERFSWLNVSIWRRETQTQQCQWPSITRLTLGEAH